MTEQFSVSQTESSMEDNSENNFECTDMEINCLLALSGEASVHRTLSTIYSVNIVTDLQPLCKEVFVQQGHEAGGGQHALPVHHPVKRLHLLLVRVDNQLLQTKS